MDRPGEIVIPVGGPPRQLDPKQMRVNFLYDVALPSANILTINGRVIKVTIDDLKYVEEIGRGNTGFVAKYLCQGHTCAIKIMPNSNNADERRAFIMDVDVVRRKVVSPFIVEYYGYLFTDAAVMICMEAMDICLDRLLLKTKNQPIPERIIGKIASSVLLALHYLKEHHNIIHRDVKPSNILLNSSGHIKICDFGISGNLVNSLVYTEQAGCRPYMAPERLTIESGPYGIHSDVWSFGITLVELARGRYPLPGDEFSRLSALIDNDPPVLKSEEGFSEDFVDFISLLLKKNPNERPKYAALLEHPFIIRSQGEDTKVGEWLKGIIFDPIA